MRKRVITKTQFATVMRGLKKGETPAQIAGTVVFDVSQATVKEIRRAGTWEEWTRRKDAKNDRKKAARQVEKQTKGHSARPELVTKKPVAVKASKKSKPLTNRELIFKLKTRMDDLEKILDVTSITANDSAKTATDAKNMAADALRKQNTLIRSFDAQIAARFAQLGTRFRRPRIFGGGR